MIFPLNLPEMVPAQSPLRLAQFRLADWAGDNITHAAALAAIAVTMLVFEIVGIGRNLVQP